MLSLINAVAFDKSLIFSVSGNWEIKWSLKHSISQASQVSKTKIASRLVFYKMKYILMEYILKTDNQLNKLNFVKKPRTFWDGHGRSYIIFESLQIFP